MTNSKKIGLNTVDGYKSFFEDFYPTLCLFANNYLNDEANSADVVQDAFIYIWKRTDTIINLSAAKTYLYKYVKNRCINILRDSKRHEEILKEKLDSEIFYRDNLIEQETYNLIYQSIKDLSPQAQKVIELSLDGFSNNEIALELKLSVNSVKTVKKRAFKALREVLSPGLFSFLSVILSEES